MGLQRNINKRNEIGQDFFQKLSTGKKRRKKKKLNLPERKISQLSLLRKIITATIVPKNGVDDDRLFFVLPLLRKNCSTKNCTALNITLTAI